MTYVSAGEHLRKISVAVAYRRPWRHSSCIGCPIYVRICFWSFDIGRRLGRGSTIRIKIGAEANDSDRPRVLLLFLEPVSSSEMSEFKWDILHLVRQEEEESAGWSWGSKQGPESCCLGLIKPCGTYLLNCEDHDAGLSHIGSRLGRIYCVLLVTRAAIWYTVR